MEPDGAPDEGGAEGGPLPPRECHDEKEMTSQSKGKTQRIRLFTVWKTCFFPVMVLVVCAALRRIPIMWPQEGATGP